MIDIYSNVCSNKLVIDTDGGADDASSILLALSAWANKDSDYEVVAITCVHGNTFEKNVEKNILKIITVANASSIKIYRGAEKPLVGNTTFDNFFGNDGLGDFVFKDKISSTIDKSTYAAVALTKLARSYPRKLSVLCLGPLTNIAIAASLDPNFMDNVRRFYIMGGSVAGVGNKAPGVEFNFVDDPESNFIVLNYTREEPSLLYPWETMFLCPRYAPDYESSGISVMGIKLPCEEYTFDEENPMTDMENAFEKGKFFLSQGDIPSAVLCFESAVKQEPNNAEIWELLGTSQAENEKDPNAIAALKRSLDLNPNNPKVMMSLAVSYTNESLQNQALNMLVNWLRCNKNYQNLVPPTMTSVDDEILTSSIIKGPDLKEVQQLFLTAVQQKRRLY